MKEYLVIRDQFKLLGGKLNTDRMTATLNKYAANGWRVISVIPHDVKTGIGSHSQEVVITFERDT